VSGRLTPEAVDGLLRDVPAGDAEHALGWPGVPSRRQPVQVLYVPADRFTATTPADAGAEALRLLDAHAPDPVALADLFGLDRELASDVRGRVAAKLAEQPLEDVRVDFEDGYVGRDAAQEDRDADATARAVAEAGAAGTLPPYVGLRVKSFTDGLARRSVTTLDRFLGSLLDAAGELPDGFVITFPKIVAVAHVRAFVEVLEALEDAHGLPGGRLRFEAQIETTPSVLDTDGRVALRAIREAGGGRLVAAHIGIYDYTAGLGLPPGEQRLDHPACDLARHLLQVTFAGTEVALADGSTNAVPADDSTAEVHRVWRRHAADVRHSLRHGFVQGWDLHPSHLVSRYAVVFGALLGGLGDALDRLGRWHRDEQGGGVLDEPATVRTLTAQVQRAIDCGAIDPVDVTARTGLDLAPRPATLR
jgi:citrate lyase beta subunit